MKKILVFGMTENPGGVESFLMNYYRRIDKSNFLFDFLCNSFEKIAYEDEIMSNGSKTIHFIARSKNPVLYYKQLNDFFKKHAKEYDDIWVNVCSLANIDYLILAKKYGIKKRIIHSHNSQNMDSKLRGFLHEYNKKRLAKYATDFWACSKDAVDWFFSDQNKEKAIVVPNAIDVEKSAFSNEARRQIRSQLGWYDCYIIGNVGRFHFQKNQDFIVDVFNEYQKKDNSARLVMIGQGEDEEVIKRKITELGIKDKVCMPGLQDNISEWLSAFDLFLFPSRFEGLSIAALEAQANGVPVLASAKVMSDEVKINSNFLFFSLSENYKKWSGKIDEMKNTINRISKDEIINGFIERNLEINTQVDKVENIL